MGNSENIAKALAQLKKGDFIVIYDGDEREGEADLVFNAKFATPEKIESLRKEAGGLICLAIGSKIAEKLELPFLSDILANSSVAPMITKKTAYGDKPAFSIAINHKGVYTGIPDNDRALTIRKFAEITEEKDAKEKFTKEFYTPGHVFLLIGRELKNRKGHTELSLELAKRAEMGETMVLCEMLGKGKALSKKDASNYAKKNNLVFLEGEEIYG